MNNKYLNITEGEITIYCAQNVRHCVESSLELARALAQKGKVLYLNTGFTNRKFLASMRDRIPNGMANFTALKIEPGRLSLWSLESTLKDQNIKYLIINAWEFAHNSYTQKERTIFGLMGMLNEFGITVLVYSHVSREKVDTGKIQRGCLGKLSGLADQIINVKKEEKGLQEDSAADSQSASVASPGGLRVRPTSEKLETIKINKLDYARRGSGVSIGGELIMPEVEIESEVMVEELELA